MDESPNLTLTRRRQRRPDLQTECTLPAPLAQRVADVEVALSGAMNDTTDGKPAEVVKAMTATCGALTSLRTTATTPELQLRAVSKITSSVRECRLGRPENQAEHATLTASERAFMDTLILRFVFPFLLDCRVRYLHKALTTLFRTTYIITEETHITFEAIFLESLQHWCEPSVPAGGAVHVTEMHLFMSTMDENVANVTTTSSPSLSAAKERVMYFLNSIDGLSSTLMPMMPSVFFRTFLTVLPLLGECLQWAVEQALANSHGNVTERGEAASVPSSPTSGTGSTTTVFGEDLEHVRFCARVVATYMHKYMGRLTGELQSPTSTGATCHRMHCDLARLLWPTVLMLSSEAFPKDVLNAAGLLLASILTVRACDAVLLVAVCRAVCEDDDGSAAGANGSSRPRPGAMRHLEVAEKATAELCGAGSGSPDVDMARQFPALSALCATMTKNARFAVLKGLLAHLSAPIHGDMRGMCVLMLPATTPDTTAEACVPLYNVILPYAERYAHALSEPETRFMAIQCMDSVVRHLVAVLSACQQALLGEDGGSDDPSGSVPFSGEAETRAAKRARKELSQKKKKPSSPEQVEANAAAVRRLLPACLPSASMLHALHVVTQLAMGLWDDGTQQMSGTLYGTYDEILCAQEMAVWFQRQLSSPMASTRFPAILAAAHGVMAPLTEQADAAAALAASLDLAQMLRDVLSIQNERRGKYHALLGLMSVLPSDVFLASAAKYGDDGLTSFSVMLLGGATNHKIGNVCGEVFCKTVALVRASAQDGSGDALVKTALLRPLAMAIVVDGYVTVASNVDTATAISNTVAHFVTPLLRQDATRLPMLLQTLDEAAVASAAPGSAPTGLCPRGVQGVVEIVTRARSVGLDVSPYLTPGQATFDMLQRTTQVLPFELRNAALNLLVLSPKKAEPVVAWQCDLVEAFVSLNLQLGGDNTARKMLFETLRKWTRRLHDTFGARPTSTAVLSAYQTLLFTHGTRLSHVLTAHIGTPEAPLAVERRVAAMHIYKMLLTTFMTALLGPTTPQTPTEPATQALIAPFFVADAVPMLVTDLSDGWEQTRLVARELLELFARHTPSSVFEADARVAKQLVEADAYTDLVQARTYRNAEGAVQRITLCVLHRSSSATPQGHIADSLCARLTTEVAALGAACDRIETLTGHAALDFVVSTPLHGRLSLCIQLVGPLLAAGTLSSAVKAVSDDLLRVASRVIAACSGLVGGDGDGDAGEVVDCRGHVYTKGDPGAEAMMRRVVNNTWLSVRVATAVVTCVLGGGAKVEQLDFPAVRGACYALMHVLLCTKHNGVMRCAREALKKALEILIRSRSADLHAVPREMLEHLLGDEGVTSTDVGRMLRRSQGLPHALLAVLEAEDSTMPFVLFGVAMTSLMRVAKAMHTPAAAATTTSSSAAAPHQALPDLALSQCSNGLNVLKFVFEDRTLADRAVAYLEEAFTTATSGFNHESWYIRNSCLMLFASVLQRLIGEHPSMGGAGVNTSLYDLGRRAPAGVVFALDTLHTAQQTETLALFPILQMLSMLSPDPPQLWHHAARSDTDSAEASARGEGVAAMVPAMVNAVALCGRSPSLMVRSASAVALACVVPIESIQNVMLNVAACFQGGDQHRCGLNGLHGALLQLHQFHRQYVGTVQRTSRRRLLSGYATPAVRHMVSTTAATCLLSRWDTTTLARLCACPTTTAALLALLADVLVFGPQNGLSPETESALIQLAQPILKDSLVASAAPWFHVTDRGAVREHAGAVLLASIATVCRRPSDATPLLGEVMALWGTLLNAEQRRLLIACNVDQHQDLVTSLLEAYLDASASARPAVETFLSTTTRLTGFDLCDANARVLERAVAPHLARLADDARGSAEQWLGCLTSRAFATHTCFARLLAARSVASAECRELRHPLLSSVATSFRAIFSAHIASPSTAEADADANATYAVALETEAPALELITTLSTVADGGVDAELIRLLTFYSDPDQAELLRRVVVDCLGVCFTSTGRVGAIPVETRAPLLFLLLRLLCDDTSAVRDAACQVCSAAAEANAAGSRDQFTCVLSVVKALHACTREAVMPRDTMARHCEVYLSTGAVSGAGLTTAATDEEAGANGEEEEEDDDDTAEPQEEEEVLFEKEADNMFAEPGLIAFLVSRILYGTRDGAKQPGVPHFPIFDGLLEPATDDSAVHKCTLTLLSF